MDCPRRPPCWPVRCLIPILLAVGAGCATPQYAIRPTPTPDESAEAVRIERTISALQAEEFQRQQARALGPRELVHGFPVQQIVDRLSQVAERSHLQYRAYLYEEDDPNAAALADGRVYISRGMLRYLAHRGRVDELAFVLAHELAHTAAQHLVQRYQRLQQHALLMGLVGAGAAAATADAGGAAQGIGRLAIDAASLLNDVALSGYSQEQELEADQLGIRYVMRAGFNPEAALDLLQDFSQFESPWPFLRTHPYTAVRRQYLQRYLAEQRTTVGSSAPAPATRQIDERIKPLRETQRLYPVGSLSWKNLQRQIDALEGSIR